MTIRVLVADGQRLFRAGVIELLQPFTDVDVVGQAVTGAETLELVRELRPDVVLYWKVSSGELGT